MAMLTWFSTDPNVSGDQDTFWWLCQRCRSFGKIKLTHGAFKHIDCYVLIVNQSRMSQKIYSHIHHIVNAFICHTAC